MAVEGTQQTTQQTPQEAADDLDARIQELSTEEADAQLDLNFEAGDAEEGREAERTAASKGWVPKNRYKGDPSKWVDAKTFNERGAKFNKNLQAENALLKQQLTEFKGTAEAFKKFHQEAMEQKERELQSALRQIKREIREADRNGDDDLVEQLEDRKELLDKSAADLQREKEAVQKPTTQEAQLDPVLQGWIDEGNEWFRDNAGMREVALEIAAEMRKDPNQELGRPFLDEVRRRMEEEMPRKFGQSSSTPRTPRRSPVDSSNRSSASSSGGKASIRDLPAEDRALCAQFVREGWTTEEKFLESYFARNPRR